MITKEEAEMIARKESLRRVKHVLGSLVCLVIVVFAWIGFCLILPENGEPTADTMGGYFFEIVGMIVSFLLLITLSILEIVWLVSAFSKNYIEIGASEP